MIKVYTSASEAQISEILHGIQGIENLSFEKSENGSTALISTKGTEEIRPQIAKAVIAAGYDLFELVLQRNSLEDVFHILTTENGAE